jgi:hypothetical protein
LALALISIGSVLLAACTSPIALTPQYTPSGYGPPPPPRETWARRPLVDAGPVCTIRLVDVADIRPDKTAMGTVGGRTVSETDSVAWLNAALRTLSRDPRVRFAPDGAHADLELRVRLIKAYIINITTAKSSNVVLRTSFERDGIVIDESVERGRDTGTNWASGEDETKDSLDSALSRAMDALDVDLIAHCGTPH